MDPNHNKITPLASIGSGDKAIYGLQPTHRGRAAQPERRGALNTWHKAAGRSTSAVGSREHASALWSSSVSPPPALTPANLAGQSSGQRARRPHGGLDRP